MSIRFDAFRRRGLFLTTWRSPSTFTALVPVTQGSEEQLRASLAELEPDLTRTLRGVGDLHSFRLVVVPATAPGMSRLHLLLNLVHDRPLGEHLQAIIASAGMLLGRAFAATGAADPAALPQLWKDHRVRENTLHLGALRRTVADIILERDLREAIGRFADEALARGRWKSGTPAETVRVDIREHILGGESGRNLPSGPAPALSAIGRALQFADLLKTFAFPAMGTLFVDITNAVQRIPDRGKRELTGVAYALWWIYAGIPTGVTLLSVRALELLERHVELPPADPLKVARLEAVEDLRLKNEVTYWFAVKDSWVRRQLMMLVLYGSEGGCRHLWTNGALSEIDTIHYARLLQLPGKQAMLFMSDYDGSLDRYLLDFTGVGSRAVIPISSNVAGCPKTRWLYGKDDPTTFDPRLVNLLRTYQLETSVWYNAYPFLTVRDVLVNGAIREGLFAETMAEEDAQRWADLL